jgi:L-amino acid N-acyltransferase YncA
VGARTLTVAIRPYSPADLDAVSEIFGWYAANSAATFEEDPRPPSDWAALAGQLAALGLPFLVAEADGALAGYAYAGPWRRKPGYRYTVEDSIFLAPGQAGRGIGRQLLIELLTACAAAGVREVIAVIADSDAQASVRLHEACGFSHAGRLADVGYKHGRWISTLIMQRSLS